MRRRVFVVAGEYSASPRHLRADRRERAFFAEPHAEVPPDEVARAFFRFPNRREDGRTTPEDWERAFGLAQPVGLTDLFASAAHRALSTLHTLTGGSYRATRDSITDLFVTSMPGLDPNERVNIGLLPQSLRALLQLSPRARAQFVVGTSDSGAWTFAQAVRAARSSELPATMLVVAGQIIPSGYASQYQIRTVLGEDDQAHGLDMLAVGDLVMDLFRRNLGLRREELEAFLARVSARKTQAGAHYPAGIQAGKPFKRDARRTPYFDAADIAVPCCGAAATIITSDEDLVEAIAGSKHPRFRTAPVTEVLGVGEGSSNQDFLQRKSPLVFATAVREALADTADDARLPLSTFASAAFGVVHDAFPSIELSFLLSLGLGWERAAERMAEGWSNPVGGLLSFGHALGASGLVQVSKAHHVFCVDQRYLVDDPAHRRQGFRADGALAFTTSVGGPLSHIVGALFRGGYQELRLVAEDDSRRAPGTPLGTAWREKRNQLRLALPSFLRGADGDWLVEGTTQVSIRSCLRALQPGDIAQLSFEGIEELVLPAHLETLRGRLRSVVAIVRQESDRVSAMFDVFRLLTDEVREVAAAYRADGFLLPAAAALSDERVADKLKECLRVPIAVLCRPAGEGARREVRFLATAGGLDEVDLVSPETGLQAAAVRTPPEGLPFWSARATRPPDAAPAAGVDELMQRDGGPRTAFELELLRSFFAPDPPRAREAGAAGAPPAEAPVRSVFYLAEIAELEPGIDPAAAHELLGRAAREARAYLEAYESNVVQLGTTLGAVAFERPPFRAGPDEALFSAARFAHEVARHALEYGVVLRAAVCFGEGAVFEDTSGHPSVASPAGARAASLLAALRPLPRGRPSFILADASPALLGMLTQRLTGWKESTAAPAGATLWRGPAARDLH